MNIDREDAGPSVGWPALTHDIEQLRAALLRLSLSLKDLLFEAEHLQQRAELDRVCNALMQRISRQDLPVESNQPPM